MGFFIKLAASTVGVLCTTASAYVLIDEKKRYGIVLAANIAESSTDSNSTNLIKPDPKSLSSPIRSNEQWNWNWDGLVWIMIYDCFDDQSIYIL